MIKTLRIKIKHPSEFPNYVKDEEILISVLADIYDEDKDEENQIDITNSPSLTIDSLDQENFQILKGLSNGKIRVLCKKEGSGIIKASYVSNGSVFYNSIQFICHSTFFKDNYLTYFLSEFDAQKIIAVPKVKTVFDTIMEMLDILYAYNEDLKVINNFRYGKSKFLSQLSQNLGFERIDFLSFNSPYELSSNETFRELMGNILDLLSIRGTKLAYELFFGSLGYDISIYEFWYDESGNLIEIKSDNESESTFFAYFPDGTPVDQPQVPRPDPRKNIPVNSVFTNNKSNYVRVSIDGTKNESIAPPPNTFSAEKRTIIRKYLDFLRPSHVQYIKETLPMNIAIDTIFEEWDFDETFIRGEVTQLFYEDFISFLDNNSDIFVVGSVKNIFEEFGTRTRYDSRRKYDEIGARYDFAAFLEENFNAVRV